MPMTRQITDCGENWGLATAAMQVNVLFHPRQLLVVNGWWLVAYGWYWSHSGESFNPPQPIPVSRVSNRYAEVHILGALT